MELHNLHVAERRPRPVRERDAVGGLVRRARECGVHRGPGPRRQERDARGDHDEAPRPDVEDQRARRAPRVVAQQLDGAALLEPRDVRTRLGLLGQAVHDLDAGEVAFVDRAVVALAGERLLVDPALARPVEEAAVAPFELERASWRFGDERPDELLVVDEAAARERVEQVRLEGVGLGEDRVVAALHHAGAAGAPEEPLDDDRDAELRRRVGGVERGAKARAARAEDQDVGLGGVDHPVRSAWSRARPTGPIQYLVLKALPTSVPSRPTTNTVGVPVPRLARFVAPVGSRWAVGWTFFCIYTHAHVTTA